MATRFILHMLLACMVFAAPGAFPATESGDEAVDSAPVILDGKVLFRLRGVSALPAKERVANVHAKIVAVADDPAIKVESGRLEESGDRVTVFYGDQEVVNFFDADAALEGTRLHLLAEAALTRLSVADVAGSGQAH